MVVFFSVNLGVPRKKGHINLKWSWYQWTQQGENNNIYDIWYTYTCINSSCSFVWNDMLCVVMLFYVMICLSMIRYMIIDVMYMFECLVKPVSKTLTFGATEPNFEFSIHFAIINFQKKETQRFQVSALHWRHLVRVFFVGLKVSLYMAAKLRARWQVGDLLGYHGSSCFLALCSSRHISKTRRTEVFWRGENRKTSCDLWVGKLLHAFKSWLRFCLYHGNLRVPPLCHPPPKK